MGADDLRHLRGSLRDVQQNLHEVGRILRRLRRGIAVARRRLDTFAQSLSDKARRAAQPSGDGWPKEAAEFGDAVRRARESAGLSRRGLANLVGVADQTIANVERAERLCRADTRRWLVETFTNLNKPGAS
jgi:hypothetical protein